MVRDSFPDNAGNRYCKVCKQGSDVSLECIGMSIAWCLFCLSIIGGAILRHCGLRAAYPVVIKIVSKMAGKRRDIVLIFCQLFLQPASELHAGGDYGRFSRDYKVLSLEGANKRRSMLQGLAIFFFRPSVSLRGIVHKL